MTDGLNSDHLAHDCGTDADGATSTRVVRCVAAALDRDPLDLPPLYDSIDPDALDTLVPHSPEGGCRLSFRFAGVEVLVSELGDIQVVSTDG